MAVTADDKIDVRSIEWQVPLGGDPPRDTGRIRLVIDHDLVRVTLNHRAYGHLDTGLFLAWVREDRANDFRSQGENVQFSFLMGSMILSLWTDDHRCVGTWEVPKWAVMSLEKAHPSPADHRAPDPLDRSSSLPVPREVKDGAQ
jgi:hypothetical protein